MTPTELRAAGHDLDSTSYERLRQFADALLIENQHINLTAARDAETLWQRHICDSLALLTPIAAADARRVLDVGSGGGLPGGPVACVRPAAQVVLLEATRKKTLAIERILAGAGVTNAPAVCERAETLAHQAEHREQYDVVTARAVDTLATLLEYVAGFVRVGGQAWLFKTQDTWEREVAQAETAARACGLVLCGTQGYLLPGETEPRMLVGYTKHIALSEELPRAVGKPHKKPL